jgi:hypothetical protein
MMVTRSMYGTQTKQAAVWIKATASGASAWNFIPVVGMMVCRRVQVHSQMCISIAKKAASIKRRTWHGEEKINRPTRKSNSAKLSSPQTYGFTQDVVSLERIIIDSSCFCVDCEWGILLYRVFFFFFFFDKESLLKSFFKQF